MTLNRTLIGISESELRKNWQFEFLSISLAKHPPTSASSDDRQHQLVWTISTPVQRTICNSQMSGWSDFNDQRIERFKAPKLLSLGYESHYESHYQSTTRLLKYQACQRNDNCRPDLKQFDTVWHFVEYALPSIWAIQSQRVWMGLKGSKRVWKGLEGSERVWKPVNGV